MIHRLVGRSQCRTQDRDLGEKCEIHRISWDQRKRGKMKEGANAVTGTDSAMFDLATDKELTAK